MRQAGSHRSSSGFRVKNGINTWKTAGRVEEDPPFRSIRKADKIGESPSHRAVWAVAKEIEIENFDAHDLRRTCAKLCRKAGGDLEQSKLLLALLGGGHRRYLGPEQNIALP